MKKIIFLFAMILAVGTVSAIDKTVDLTSPTTTECEWNSSTGVVTFTQGTAGSVLFAVSGVDNYTSMDIAFTSQTGGNVRVFLIGESGEYNINNTVGTTYNSNALFGSQGTKTLKFNVTETIGSITGIRVQNISTDANAAVWTISSIKFYNVENSNTIAFNNLATGGSWTNNTLVSLPFEVSGNNTSGTNWTTSLVGTDSGVDNYADITDYRALIFYIKDFSGGGGKIKVFAAKSDDTSPTELYGEPINAASPTFTDKNYTADGYYYVDLNDYSKLIGIKTNSPSSETSFKITECYLVKKTFRINDGVDAGTIVYDPKCPKVVYDREFTAGNKATICMPFGLTSATYSSQGSFYYFNNVDDSGKLEFKPASYPGAYTPYIFQASTTCKPFTNITNKEIKASAGQAMEVGKTNATAGTFTFKGTLANVADLKSSNSSNTVYGWVSSDGSFKKAGSNVSIDAFRAYILGPSSATARLNVVFDDEATGIETMNREPLTVNQTYNLSGQRVSQPTKGLYIVNGKKVVVK